LTVCSSATSAAPTWSTSATARPPIWRAMYHSIHDTLLALPDRVTVMPAHGAGSSCGKNLSTQLTSTIGEQHRTNPSVQPMSEGDFVDLITHGQPAAPSYFSVDAAMDKRVHPMDQHRKIPHRLRLRSARLSTTAYGWWMPAASTTSRPDICGLDQRRRDRRPPGCTWTAPPVRSRALRSSTPPPSTTGTKPSRRVCGSRGRGAGARRGTRRECRADRDEGRRRRLHHGV
jgi:hypothetical protein